jgi:carbonic anhydrase/acetyltransferase-like protein (isoleucine patch superfamily)
MRRLAARIASRTLRQRRRLACYALGDKVPDTRAAAFIAPSASIIGAVTLDEDASVWYNCTLRGDVASISIGARTNVQDGTVIHVDSDALGSKGSTPTVIGADCTIGHMALLHACTLGDGAFVGMNTTLMSHTTVESGGMVAAGALLTSGKTVGRGELWGGAPAKFMRTLTPGEAEFLLRSARAYVGFAQAHASGLRELPTRDEASTAATGAPRWR